MTVRRAPQTGESGRSGGTLSAEAASELLGTTPAMLARWEERFGLPVAQPSEDGQLRYPESTVMALREALTRGSSIAAAISEVRAREVRRRRRRHASGVAVRHLRT